MVNEKNILNAFKFWKQFSKFKLDIRSLFLKVTAPQIRIISREYRYHRQLYTK